MIHHDTSNHLFRAFENVNFEHNVVPHHDKLKYANISYLKSTFLTNADQPEENWYAAPAHK